MVKTIHLMQGRYYILDVEMFTYINIIKDLIDLSLIHKCCCLGFEMGSFMTLTHS